MRDKKKIYVCTCIYEKEKVHMKWEKNSMLMYVIRVCMQESIHWYKKKSVHGRKYIPLYNKRERVYLCEVCV